MHSEIIRILPALNRKVVEFAANNLGTAAFSGLSPKGSPKDERSYTGMNACRDVSRELCNTLNNEYGVECQVRRDEKDHHHLVCGEGFIADSTEKQFFTSTFLQAGLLNRSQKNPSLFVDSRDYLQSLRMGFRAQERSEFAKCIMQLPATGVYLNFDELRKKIETLGKFMADSYGMPPNIRQIVSEERVKSYGNFNEKNFVVVPPPITKAQAKVALRIFNKEAQRNAC